MITANKKKLSVAGVLIAMGIVYGDIGTSPLYVMKTLVQENGSLKNLDEEFILGSVSLIFWTLTLLTTIKYVLIALNADNNGEGGIFSLYTLVKKQGKYLIIPAMIGGAALLADGVLTPAVTVTTAIEGLRGIPVFYTAFGNNQTIIIIITLIILLFIFTFQRFGTDKVGKAFGPIMFTWFSFLGLVGLFQFGANLSVIRALNPLYAFHLLVSPENKLGIFILGNVFLATTGAEAIYSDLGHVGKHNIYASWPYIKICLILNYLGQAAWLLKVYDKPSYQSIDNLNPFFQIIPAKFQILGVCFATLAAIIASQSLLSGSFTLVTEAIKLKLLPKMKIRYPGSSIGQMYIPAINFILWFACSLIVLFFKTSTKMEAAYGLSITITMLMTTTLLYFYLNQKQKMTFIVPIVTLFFLSIESIFFIASASKFLHGGYVAVLIALSILAIMIIWFWSNQIKEKSTEEVYFPDYIPQLEQLRNDPQILLEQTNIVFLVPKMENNLIPKQFLYSILDKYPKKALTYWFVNVEVTDEPYTQEYQVEMNGTNFTIQIKLFLGFRIKQQINIYIRQIIQDLMADNRLPKQPQKYSITRCKEVGNFKFVLIQEELSNVTNLSKWERQVMQARLFIKKYTATPQNWFGLQYSDVLNETVPLIIGQNKNSHLTERKT